MAKVTDPAKLDATIQENGQQKDYLILSTAERAKGFVRPVRSVYTHKKCGTETIMDTDIAETYARRPSFYHSTYCFKCQGHFLVGEFHWSVDGTGLGT